MHAPFDVRPAVATLLVAWLGLCACETEPDTITTDAACDAGSTAACARHAAAQRGQASRDAGPSTHAEDAGPVVPPSDARPGFCQREGSDRIRDLFCAQTPAQVRNLLDLQTSLAFKPDLQGAQFSVVGTNDAKIPYNYIVALGHSTALAGHVVSPINPRVFLLRSDTIMAFQRGVQHVELVGRDRKRGGFNFYLLSFRQRCNAAPGGCSPADLFTQRLENDWDHIQIRDDEELKNTALDCRQCHARGGGSAQLLMRELRSPWTHFFQPIRDEAGRNPEPGVTGIDLTRDYLAARGDEPYGNIPVEVMRNTSPVLLQDAAGPHQPVLFDSPTILSERWSSDADGGSPEPQPSPTWERAYAAFKRGEQLPLPYVEPRATDPDKQARLTRAYARYRRGEESAEQLPALWDIFPDDASTRARIGLQTEPDATPVDALIQACASCHNDVLDQSISRARFNVDLSKLDRDELDRAIERISLPPDAPGVMPPVEGRQLDAATRERLLSYLRTPGATEPVPALQRAAQLGMAGPKP